MKVQRSKLGLFLGFAMIAAGCSGNDEDDLGSTELDGGGDIGGDAAMEDGSVPHDSGTGSDAGQPEDSGSEPMDASNPGDGDGDSNDAGDTSDAGDGSTPAGNFSLRVVTERLPVPGLSVAFHNADGSTDATLHPTSAQGYVFAATAPAAVTVIDDSALTRSNFVRLVTYLGTENSDALTVRVPDMTDFADDQRAYSLEFPDTVKLTATRFEVHFGLDVNVGTLDPDDLSQPVTLHVTPDTMRFFNPMLVYGRDGGNKFVQYLFAKHLAAAGMDSPVSAPLQLSPDTFYSVGIQNWPADTNSGSVGLSMLGDGISFVAEEEAYSDGAPDIFLDGQRRFHINSDFAESLDVVAHLESFTGPMALYDQVDRVATPHSSDANPVFSRNVDLQDIERLDNYEVTDVDGHIQVSWTYANDAPLTDADAQFVTFRWNGTASFEWTVVIPPGITSFVFPEVTHATLGTLVPDVNELSVVTALDDSNLDSYAKFKQGVLDFTNEGGGRQFVFSLPLYLAPRGATGRLRAISAMPNNL
ncbi:MAG: hypothetical protein QM778_22395 [Myxococcales bacterium]